MPLTFFFQLSNGQVGKFEAVLEVIQFWIVAPWIDVWIVWKSWFVESRFGVTVFKNRPYDHLWYSYLQLIYLNVALSYVHCSRFLPRIIQPCTPRASLALPQSVRFQRRFARLPHTSRGQTYLPLKSSESGKMHRIYIQEHSNMWNLTGPLLPFQLQVLTYLLHMAAAAACGIRWVWV